MTIGPFTSLWVFDEQNLAEWLTKAQIAIETLQALPGFIEAQAGRSPDEPSRLIVTTKWEDVGSYRRALSSYAAKISVWPFLANMHDQPSAFEVLLSADSAAFSEYKSSLET
jgi:hypothetical protein